jgi:hypothetical protein
VWAERKSLRILDLVVNEITYRPSSGNTFAVYYVVHSPTNTLFINLVKSFKFTLKYSDTSANVDNSLAEIFVSGNVISRRFL